MSKVWNTRFALKCSTEGYVLLDDINLPAIQQNASVSFTIRAELALLYMEGSSLLVGQEDAFALKVLDKCAVFEMLTKNGYKEVLRYNLHENGIEEKQFFLLDVVVDHQKVFLSLNGSQVAEEVIELPTSLESKQSWKIGRLDGYVSHIEWYDKALSQEAIVKKFFYQDVDLSQQRLSLNFAEDIYELEPKKSINPQRIKECRRVNVTHTFHPGCNGFAIPLYQPSVSLVNETKSYFTLLIKAYLLSTEDKQEEFTLFSENSSKKQFFAVGVSASTKKPYLVIEETKFDFTTAIPPRKWSDIAICVDGLTIQAFIDGEKSGEWTMDQSQFTKVCKPIIGNQLINANLSQGFNGHIDSVAIFDYPLEAETLKKYADKTCFMYSRQLLAYWNFRMECPIESCSQTVLVLGNSSQQILVDDLADISTMSEIEMEWSQYNKLLSEEDEEVIDNINSALDSTFEMLTGTSTPKLLLNDTDRKVFASMLAVNKSSKINRGIGFGGLLGCAIGAGICMYWYYKKEEEEISAFRMVSRNILKRILRSRWKSILCTSAIGGLGGAYVGAFFVKKFEEEQRLLDGLELRSARCIFDKKIKRLTVDEELEKWEKTKKQSLCELVAIVAGSATEDLSMNVEVKLTVIKGSSNEYTIKLQEDTLGETEEQSIKVTASETKIISFSFPKEKISLLQVGQYDKSVKVRVNKKDFTIPVCLKVIAATTSLWSKTSVLPLWMFDLCMKIRDTQSAVDVYKFADLFVDWIRKEDRLKVCSDWSNKEGGSFSTLSSNGIIFHLSKFAEKWKLKDAKIEIGPQDACALLIAMTTLQGWDYLSIKFAEPDNSNSTKAAKLSLRSVKPLKNTNPTKDLQLDRYPLCVELQAACPRIWDPFCTLYNQKNEIITEPHHIFATDDRKEIGVSEITTSSYRSLFCLAGTSCRLSKQASDLSLLTEERARYAIVAIDLWSTHECQGAVSCVTELSDRINTLLLNLLNNDPKAHFVICPSDLDRGTKNTPGVLAKWEICRNFNDIRLRAINKVVMSDYHIGVRKKFCFKGERDQKRYKLDVFTNSKYVEFIAKKECDCANNPGPSPDKHINDKLNTFITALKTNEEDATKPTRGVVLDNTDAISQYLIEQSIKDVYLMGVHTNMCLVFRKCGILQLLRNKFNVHLVTDLTDARISRFHYPYQEHFQATETIINYITNTPILIEGVSNKCVAVNSKHFDEKMDIFRFEKDFRFPTTKLSADPLLDSTLTDTYADYNQANRPMFPIALYYQCNEQGISTLLFEYANARNSNELTRLGVGFVGPRTQKIKFEPGEYITEAKMEYSTTGNKPLVRVEFLTTKKKNNKYTIVSSGTLDESKLSQLVCKANRTYDTGDYFGNKDYAFICPKIISFLCNGEQYITGMDFYATTFNKFEVKQEGKTSSADTEIMNRIDFAYNYYVEDYTLEYKHIIKKELENYAFVFFEGEFYLYEKLGQEYYFMRRTDSLLLNSTPDEGGPNDYYESDSYSLDAQLLETKENIPFYNKSSNGNYIQYKFHWLIN